MDRPDQVTAELDQCRRELAAVRTEQEDWAEDLHRERRRRSNAEQRLRALSRAVDALLTDGPPPVQRSRSRREERGLIADADRIRASNLFHGPWYLRHYPDAARSGLSPARHYLEIGAAAGHDPGPSFSTTEYLRVHPGLIEDGVNPLLHHLDGLGND
jgi:hypothetical protein